MRRCTARTRASTRGQKALSTHLSWTPAHGALGDPAVVIGRRATVVQHYIRAGGAARAFATAEVDATTRALHGLRLKVPIVLGLEHLDQAGRYPDAQVAAGVGARFQKENTICAIRGEALGKGAARCSCSDDDVVPRFGRCRRLLQITSA